MRALSPRLKHPSGPSARGGFTLIEILAVILIISILMAFLLPAINSVRTRARVTSVRTEIASLESAITAFKTQYGTEPPSSLVIYEEPLAAGGWASSSPSTQAVDSRAKIRQIWPQFDFSVVRDFNLNGTPLNGKPGEVITLTQGECLVFFLGGILKRPEDANNNGLFDSGEDQNADGKLSINVGTQRSFCTGFSKNPFNPFASGGNRDTAIFEFDTSRFVDVDGDNFPEFVDPLPSQTAPYVYASSYSGAGYRYNSSSPLFEFAGSSTGPMFFPTMPYLQGSGAGALPWKAKGFQIVSPGYDKKYGTFGSYSTDTASSDLSGSRDVEADNITNFAPGTLGGK